MDATASTSEPTGGASPSESVAFAPPAAVPSSSKGKKPVKRVLGEEEDEDGNKKKRNRKVSPPLCYLFAIDSDALPLPGESTTLNLGCCFRLHLTSSFVLFEPVTCAQCRRR